MWQVGVLCAVAVLFLVCLVVKDLALVWRQPQTVNMRPGILLAALALLLVDLAGCLWAAFLDAGLGSTAERYPVASLVFGSAFVGVAAFGYALRTLAVPRAVRSDAATGMLVLCLLIGFGISACYGLTFGGPYFG